MCNKKSLDAAVAFYLDASMWDFILLYNIYVEPSPIFGYNKEKEKNYI